VPDFSMCNQHNCPRSKKCYRFMAIPNLNQWYFMPPLDGGACEDFMPIPEKLTNAQIIENYIKSWDAALMNDPPMITKTSTKGEDDGRTKKSKKGR